MINLTNSSGASTASFGSPFPGQGVPYGAGTGRTGNFGYGALGAQGSTGKHGSQRGMGGAQMNAAPSAPNLSTPAEAMPSMVSGGEQAPQQTTINQHFAAGSNPVEAKAPGTAGEQSNISAELAE
jgi:hypothetical protein